MTEMSLVDLGKKLLESSRAGDTDEVRALMTNGAPFTTDWLGVSPLHMAAQFGHVETAQVLLRGGISRDARTKVDRTPLHIAAQEGYLDIVVLLVNHGAEIDARDMLKMTPLHWAVDRGHFDIVVFLLRNNADINALSKFEKTPIDIAVEHQYLNIMEVLHKHATDPPPTQPKAKIIQLNSANSLPNFKTNVPLILKTESLSNVIQKTLAQTVHVASPVTSATSMTPELANSILEKALKTQTVTKPMVLRANIANFQKPSAASSSYQNSSSSDSEEGESSEQSNSNVLTTLAALAEATSSNSSLSNAEAMKWLEKHGITMLPTDNSTIMASALEGGQTVTLTEAGKLALTWVKEHPNLNNNSVNPPASENTAPVTVTSSQNSTPTQKVITILGDTAHLPSIISAPQSPIVVFSNPTIQTTDVTPAKKIKTMHVKIEKDISNDSTVSSTSSETNENLKLKEELEKLKKQAELYKKQLVLKEHEAEKYKKQLEQMKTLPSVNP